MQKSQIAELFKRAIIDILLEISDPNGKMVNKTTVHKAGDPLSDIPRYI